MTHVAILIVAALVSTVSPPSLVDDADTIRKEIEAANKAFSAAYGRGDAKAVAGMYTEPGQLFPPAAQIVAGRAAIEKYWKSALDSGVKGVELKTTEVFSLGETAAETGTYALTGKNGDSLDEGKYVVVWKRVDGQWRLHRDCWNSNKPAA